MAHDTHHGHGDHNDHTDKTKAPHAGYFEVPLALGVVFWALVLVIINVFCLNCSNCCDDEKCATECKTEQTETHSSGH